MTMDPTCLTLDHVNSLDDLSELMDLCDEAEVDQTGLKDIKDYKTRLSMHILSTQKVSRKQQLFDAIYEAGKKDEEKRHKLLQFVTEIRDIFPEHTHEIHEDEDFQMIMEDILKQDGVSTHVRQDCEDRMTNLSQQECIILVAGESSAGKSSVLNLLFGREILPSHLLPCTSAITLIRYGKTPSAKVVFNSGAERVIPNLDENDGLRKLHSIAFIKEKHSSSHEEVLKRRRDGHNIVEIQVNLPLKFLESGLVLVDTPGVGENEFLENYLMEYIRAHQILGFLYVIMSDASGGIQEDRLVNLVSAIVKQQTAMHSLLRFDPKAALFVCNRWDLVDQQEDVWENALKKLSHCWPDFDRSMVVRFSTQAAKEALQIHENYINDQYEHLLKAITKLIETAMERRISAAYKWLGHLLRRSYHYLKWMLRRLDMTEKERLKRADTSKKKLETLHHKTDDVIRQLYADLQSAVKDLCQKAKEHIKTSESKRQLTTNWTMRELPDLEKGSGSWGWVKGHIDASFFSRVLEHLELWDSKEKNIPTQESNMARDARLNLSDLEHELLDIERNLENMEDTDSVASFVSMSSLRCQSLTDLTEDLGSSMHLPHKLIGRILAPFTNKVNEAKLKSYAKQPGIVARKRAEKLHKRLLSSSGHDLLQDVLQQLMQRPRQYIQCLENKIPKMIEANEHLLGKLERKCATQQRYRVQFEHMMTGIESVRRGLVHYGEDFIFANDFNSDDIKILTPSSYVRLSVPELLQSGSENPLGAHDQGLWTHLYKGEINNDGEPRHVVVRMYSKSSGVYHSFQEVAKLRCLLHTDVCLAEFLGIHQHANSPTPAFVYDGCLVSLRRYLHPVSARDKPVDYKTKVLLETAAGLQYLHAKGLVHMELSRNTVMLLESGEVKLTGASLPRKGCFPTADDVPVSGFVYLSPEVLHGDVYTSSADVYSYALLVLEVIFDIDVFKDLRQWTLKEFREKSIPVNMLSEHLKSETFSPRLREVLRSCLNMDTVPRPDIALVATEMKKVKIRCNGFGPIPTRSTKDLFRQSFAMMKKR